MELSGHGFSDIDIFIRNKNRDEVLEGKFSANK